MWPPSASGLVHAWARQNVCTICCKGFWNAGTFLCERSCLTLDFQQPLSHGVVESTCATGCSHTALRDFPSAIHKDHNNMSRSWDRYLHYFCMGALCLNAGVGFVRYYQEKQHVAVSQAQLEQRLDHAKAAAALQEQTKCVRSARFLALHGIERSRKPIEFICRAWMSMPVHLSSLASGRSVAAQLAIEPLSLAGPLPNQHRRIDIPYLRT